MERSRQLPACMRARRARRFGLVTCSTAVQRQSATAHAVAHCSSCFALQGLTDSGRLHALRAPTTILDRLQHTVNMQKHLSV